ncbi:hypothetical protein R1flu_018342 [Riccia fluitans]|uniref:Ubiquitin-like protease family profile domain-containing protein n=1 Tax=Riccia fluitans TaxID=41844 RepID=A0ABD1ZJ08_9MARC
MARSKKKAHRQSIEVFDFDPVAIAMEAAEEVTRAAIDPTIPDNQQATTGDISPATNPTQPTDNARGVGPNNIQQEDEDLQLIPPNGIPGSVALGINFNCDIFKHDFLMRDAAWRSKRPRKIIRSNPTKKSDVPLPPNARAEAPTSRKGKEKMAMQPENAFKDEVRKELRELKEAITMSHNLLLGTSFITGHRLLASDVDRAGVETSYLSICNDFKLVAASHRSPQLFYEQLKSIFDSYVNPDNNPDVQPLVKGLNAEDFDVDVFLGTNMGGRKEEMTPDFLDGLSVHYVRRLESEIENICGESQRVTRATARLRLNYEQDVLPPPTAKENVIDSTVVPIVGCSIDLTTDEAMDQPCSPPDRQIISVVPSQRVDLTAVVSLEANRCITMEWPCLSDLRKEDRESTYAKKYLRRDVINAYIFEKFLQRYREELFNMFYCSTFWFAKASQQVDAYDMTSHSESASIGIKRLRNAIYPQLRDGDFKVHPEVPAWIFVLIHGRCHWSLALIQLLGTTCAVTHLDSFPGIHKKEYIFHVLCTFLRLTMPICPKTIVYGTMEVPHQLDQYSCGIHIIQMLAGAGMKGLGLDQCWRVEKLAWIATIDQVTTMGIMLSGWLNGKFKHVP